MKIVVKKTDGRILQVADCSSLPPDVNPADVDVYDVPGWDWSLADLSGVDTSAKDWSEQLAWNGTTLVKKV